MSMEMAEVLGSNTIPPGSDGDFNLEESTGGGSTTGRIRLGFPGRSRQETENERDTSDSSETAPQTTPQAPVQIAMFKSSEPRCDKVRLSRMPQPNSEPSLLARRHGRSGATCGCDRGLERSARGSTRRLTSTFGQETLVNYKSSMLACKICNKLDDELLLEVRPYDQRDSALTLPPTSELQVKRDCRLGMATVEGGLGPPQATVASRLRRRLQVSACANKKREHESEGRNGQKKVQERWWRN